MIKKLNIIILFYTTFSLLCLKSVSQSDTLKVLFSSAKKLYIQKKYNEAINKCDEIIRINESDIDALCLRCLINYDLEKYDDAIKDCEMVKSEKIEDIAFVLSTKGKAELAAKKYRLAISDFTKLINLKPNSENGYALRGYTYTFLNKADSAILDIKKSISINSKKATAYYYLAIAFIDLNNCDTAHKYIEKALQININYADVYVLKAKCFRLKKDYLSAKKEAEKAISIDSKNYLGWYEIAEAAMNLNEKNIGFEASKKMLNLRPNNFKSYINIALYYDNNKDSMTKYLDLAIEKGNGYYNEAYFYRGVLYFSQKHYLLALKDLKKVDSVGLYSKELYLKMAYCYQTIGKKQEAEEYYNKELKENPNSFYSYLEIANFYSSINKYTQAEKNYEKAISLNKYDSMAYNKYILFYQKNNNYKASLKICSLAIDVFKEQNKVECTNYFSFMKAYYLIILSEYDDSFRILEAIKTKDASLKENIALFTLINIFCKGNITEFQKRIENITDEKIFNSYSLFQFKLMDLIIDKKYEDFLKLYINFCTDNKNEYNSFNYLNYNFDKKNDSPNKNIKIEFIGRKYAIIKQLDSNIVFTLSFIIDSTFKKDVIVPILNLLENKINISPQKEIPLLIKAQFLSIIRDKDALKTFDQVVKLNPKLNSAYYLRGIYKRDVLGDIIGAEKDFESGSILK